MKKLSDEQRYLIRTYKRMRERVNGQRGKKYKGDKKYVGLYILNKDTFLEWSNKGVFMTLFQNYCLSGKQLKYAPSVDRINPDLGYEIDNMEWVTQSENSRRSSITRKRLK